jgi:hypothetical protein
MRDNHGCGFLVRGQDKVCDTGVPSFLFSMSFIVSRGLVLGSVSHGSWDGRLFGSAAQGLMMVEYARE